MENNISENTSIKSSTIIEPLTENLFKKVSNVEDDQLNQTLNATQLDLNEENQEILQTSAFDTHFEQMVQNIELKESENFYYTQVRELFYLVSEYYNPQNLKIQEIILNEIVGSFAQIRSYLEGLSTSDVDLKNLTHIMSTPIYIENAQGLTISFYDFLTDIRSKYFVGEQSSSVTELQQKVRKTFAEDKMPNIGFSKQLQSIYNEKNAEQFAKIVFTNLYESGIKTQAIPYLKGEKLGNFCTVRSNKTSENIKPEEILRASFLVKNFNSQKEASKNDMAASRKIRLLDFAMKPYQLLLDIDSIKHSDKWFKQSKINKLKREYEKSLKEVEFLRLKENRATEQDSAIARKFMGIISDNINCITNFSTNLHSDRMHNFSENEVTDFFENLKRSSNGKDYIQIGGNKMYFKLQKQGKNTVFSLGLNKKIPRNPTKVLGAENIINNLKTTGYDVVKKEQQKAIDFNKEAFATNLQQRKSRLSSKQI